MTAQRRLHSSTGSLPLSGVYLASLTQYLDPSLIAALSSPRVPTLSSKLQSALASSRAGMTPHPPLTLCSLDQVVLVPKQSEDGELFMLIHYGSCSR